jgi:hypothetical protein
MDATHVTLSVVFALSAAAGIGIAQTRAPAKPADTGKAWTAPRTPWGDPDLQQTASRAGHS